MLTDLLDKFTQWHESTKGELEHVATLLAQSIPDDPNELLEVLAEIESWNARVGFWAAEATSFLERFQWAYLTDKEDSTETERKVKLASDTADYRKVKNQIEALADAIKQRLIMSESILAYHRQFNIKPIQEKQF